jgi:hypothetical protein
MYHIPQAPSTTRTLPSNRSASRAEWVVVILFAALGCALHGLSQYDPAARWLPQVEVSIAEAYRAGQPVDKALWVEIRWAERD